MKEGVHPMHLKENKCDMADNWELQEFASCWLQELAYHEGCPKNACRNR